MPKILELLHEQHEMVERVFQKMQEAENKSEKEKLFNQLKDDLVPHMKGEEKYFYPALEEKEGAKEDVLEGIEEHHAAKLFLKELDGMSPDSERWDAKVSVLKEMVEHHVQEEESNIFQKARSHLSEQEMQEIGENFENVAGKKKSRLTHVG